jgi:hypothetical protein
MTLGLLLFHLAGFAQVIPGQIEAENYDTNGPGVSYYDATAGNNGSVYRFDNVDIEATSDVGGGYNVGWISAGEWLQYTVQVQETAVYRFAFRVAALSGTGAIQVVIDGLPLCAVRTPSTGGWQNWQTVTISNIVLRAGAHALRIEFQSGGYNFNHLQVTRQKALTGDYLRASGKQIVNGSGENVLLRGIGLGNWMLQEPYMMDVNGIAQTQSELQARIAELVGTNHLNAFYQSWRTNYMRAADVQRLAAAGLNSIRLPMHFNLFTLPVEQEPVPGQHTFVETGFELVDQLLAWCTSNQVYLILDMHACPGGQGHNRSISDYNPPAPSLWESAANRAKLIALWREIAARYATNAWIGGYDLINEPNWTFENRSDIHGGSDQTNAPLRQLLMDVTAAIREVDTNHLIFLEGNGYGNNYNGILPPWDANLAISFHKYWDSPTAGSYQGKVNLRDEWNMPLWLGESGENSNEWFRDAIHFAEEWNIGWAWWPWKKIDAIAGTVLVRKPAGYQAILDYWRNSGPRPSTNAAAVGLLALASATRIEQCTVQTDVLDALVRPHPSGVTLPFSAETAPGLIMAADYDLGRQGEAYWDVTTTNSYNSGWTYRNDSVDVQPVSDGLPTGGFNVGWSEPGDWMKYTVTPVVAGPYRIYARVASGTSTGSFYLEVDGTNASGVITVPATGGWQTWVTIPAGTLPAMLSSNAFKLVVLSHGFNLHWLALETVPGSVAGLPAGWTDQDINGPAIAGSAARNAGTGVWAVNGSGNGIGGTSDQFHFVCTNLTGDGSLVARVTRVETTGPAKVGVMLRGSTGHNSPYAYVFQGTNTASFEARNSAGASASSVGMAANSPPRWVKLTRVGDMFSGYTSTDGSTWTLLGTRTIAMGTVVKAGLAVTAGNNAALNTALLDSFEVLPAPALPPVLSAAFSTGDGAVVLQWPAAGGNFQLYATPNLSPPVQWSPVTNAMVEQNGTFSVTVPANSVESDQRFFRLGPPAN